MKLWATVSVEALCWFISVNCNTDLCEAQTKLHGSFFSFFKKKKKHCKESVHDMKYTAFVEFVN